MTPKSGAKRSFIKGFILPQPKYNTASDKKQEKFSQKAIYTNLIEKQKEKSPYTVNLCGKWGFFGAGQGILSQSQVPLEKCQNSPPDCFSVTSYLVALGVRSHFWFESHFILQKRKVPL